MAWDGHGPSLPGGEGSERYRAGRGRSGASAGSAARVWLRPHGCQPSANPALDTAWAWARCTHLPRQALYLVQSSLPLLCAQLGGYLSFRRLLPFLFLAFERSPGRSCCLTAWVKPPLPRASGKPGLQVGGGRGSIVEALRRPLMRLHCGARRSPPSPGPRVWGLMGLEPAGLPPACPHVLAHCCATNLYRQVSG